MNYITWVGTGCTTTIEENEWDGPMTGDWHTTPSYWTPGALPGICDDVIIPSGYEVTVSSCEPALSHTLDVKKGAIFNVLIGAELEVNCKK